MKKNLFCIFAMFICVLAYAQNLPTYAPVSPNAASLGKFGAFPVNANLGTTNISIPLYTIKQGDIEIPISLSYNATSGIRVNEEASWVGLGWTLNAGGAIVRSVKGQPGASDIPDLGSLAFNQANYDYMKNVAKGITDTAQDEYLFNYSGISGKFLYNQNLQKFIFTDYKPIKISTISDNATPGFPGHSFMAFLNNGQQLEFNAHETIDMQNVLYNNRYRTVSNLTKVTSFNQNDNVTFEYDDLNLIDNEKATGDYISDPGIVGSQAPYIKVSYSKRAILTTKVLKKINFKNGFAEFDYSIDRLDSSSPKLNHIKIYSLINGSSILIKKITFNYVYYSRSGGKTYSTLIPNYNPDKHYKSLKLTHLDVYSSNNKPQVYSFEYNNTTLSARNSSGQDFWGYANNNNGSFLHKKNVLYYSASTSTSIIEIGTGDREPKEEKMKAGILTKITYPTGGYTEFEYEANKHVTTVSVPTYVGHTKSVMSEGTGAIACDTGFKTLTFSPITKPYNAKLSVVFTDALGGNGSQSYGEFNGQKYFRNPLTTIYPYTTHNVNLILSESNNYVINAMEYGDGAPGASGCPSAAVTVTWDELTGSIDQIQEVLTGGVRIKSIKNYDGVNTAFTSKKTFKYSTPQILIPVLDGDYQTLQYTGSEYINSFSSTPTYALNVNGGPSVEYLNIDEYNYDIIGKDNGKIMYEYESTYSNRIIDENSGSMFKAFIHPDFLGHSGCGNGPIPIEGIYTYENVVNNGYGNFSNYLTKPWTSGSLKKQEFYKRNLDNTYTKLKSIENTYNSVDEISILVNYVHAITPWSSQSMVSSSDFSGSPCNYANYTFMYNKGFYSFGKKLLTSTKETQFDSSGLNPIVTEKTFTYDNPSYLLTEQTVKDSNDDILRTETIYPENISSPSVPIQKLLNLHRLSVPLEVKTFKKKGSSAEKQLSHQVTQYKEWLTDKVLPEKIKALKGVPSSNNVLEDKVLFHSYYDNGNVKEVSKKDGTHVVYIWGYNEAKPIAKIENATYSQISSYVSGLLTHSNSDNDRTIDLVSGNGSVTYVGEEGDLREALKNLRISLPNNALMTSYTYDPLIGVTSITDPRGRVIYYHYDAFNRLEHVKDHDGNILSKNQYNYKN